MKRITILIAPAIILAVGCKAEQTETAQNSPYTVTSWEKVDAYQYQEPDFSLAISTAEYEAANPIRDIPAGRSLPSFNPQDAVELNDSEVSINYPSTAPAEEPTQDVGNPVIDDLVDSLDDPAPQDEPEADPATDDETIQYVTRTVMKPTTETYMRQVCYSNGTCAYVPTTRTVMRPVTERVPVSQVSTSTQSMPLSAGTIPLWDQQLYSDGSGNLYTSDGTCVACNTTGMMSSGMLSDWNTSGRYGAERHRLLGSGAPLATFLDNARHRRMERVEARASRRLGRMGRRGH